MPKLPPNPPRDLSDVGADEADQFEEFAGLVERQMNEILDLTKAYSALENEEKNPEPSNVADLATLTWVSERLLRRVDLLQRMSYALLNINLSLGTTWPRK